MGPLGETFTIGKTFALTAERWGDRTAIVDQTGAEYTYSELDTAVDGVANVLNDRGIGRGDRVAFLLRNRPEYVIGHFAAQKLGCASVLINYRLSAGEVEHIVGEANADALVYETAFGETVGDIDPDSNLKAKLVVGDDGFEAPMDDTSPVTSRGKVSDTAYICHTSGSTGLPKLVPHTHADMQFVVNQWIQEMAISRGDRAFVLVPIAHIVGFNYLHPHVYAGATSVLQREFDPAGALDLMEEASVTGYFAVPAQINAMLQVPNAEERDLSSLRYFRTGGDTITEETIVRGQEVFSEDFYNLYGLTETATNPVVYTPEDPDEKKTSVGKLWYYGWDTRVVEPAPPDELNVEATVTPPGTGVLLVRGLPVMDSYLNQPEATEEAFVDGWFYTEDIVRIDEDGFVWIVDRVDNMIVTGGENVYPQEVENVLINHPDVVDCGVTGVEDEEWGERLTALVVAESELDTDDLDGFLKESRNLADYKRPRRYDFVDEIPRNVSGSIEREKLNSMVS